MKKYLCIAGLLALTNMSNAEDTKLIKANVQLKNVHGVVTAGTWFNLALQDNIISSTGSQHFTAELVDPIMNQNLSEG